MRYLKYGEKVNITKEYILSHPDEYRYIKLYGTEYNYVITSTGDVISMRYQRSDIPHYLRPVTDEDGYKRVRIYKSGHCKCVQIHRLVAHAFIPIPQKYIDLGYDEKDLEINHKDSDPSNNDVSNLEWCTTKENIIFAWEHGNAHPMENEKHPNSVYSNHQIKNVCRMIEENKVSMKEISIATGVSYTVVKQVKNKIIWRSISDEYDFSGYNIDTRKKKNKKKKR